MDFGLDSLLLPNFPPLTLRNLIKYLVEGMAVAVAAYYIGRKTSINETLVIGLTAAVTFLTLDLLAPSLGEHARHGAGFGIGQAQVGGGDDIEEGFEAEATADAVAATVSNGNVIEGSDGIERLPTLNEQQNDVDQVNFEAAEELKKNQGSATIVDNSVPYRLIPSQYGVLSLHSGYNDQVEGYNKEENDATLAEL